MNINWGDSLIFRQYHIRKSQLKNRFLVIFLSIGCSLEMPWMTKRPDLKQLVGGWAIPLKNISQVGLSFLYIYIYILWKIKSVPNHQPDKYSWQCHLCTAYRAYLVISFGRTKLRKLLLQHHIIVACWKDLAHLETDAPWGFNWQRKRTSQTQNRPRFSNKRLPPFGA